MRAIFKYAQITQGNHTLRREAKHNNISVNAINIKKIFFKIEILE